jgi:Raf kinase inhibitor-like YbhB/YbcL family protein
MKTLLLCSLAVILCGSPSTITVTSTAFKANEFIPVKHSCLGENVSPELEFTGIPENAKSLALIMDDPDAPNGDFVHWVMWNIPVTNTIAENAQPGMQGLNGRKENKYTGPCPPSGTHHYHFKIYALDTELNLPSTTDKYALLKAMEGHVLGTGELIGLFKK